MICLIIHEIWTFAIGFVKTCSATLPVNSNVDSTSQLTIEKAGVVCYDKKD